MRLLAGLAVVAGLVYVAVKAAPWIGIALAAFLFMGVVAR
jgi:hypothetical protein